MMQRFRLDYERSLALHEAVASELRAHPELLERARRKVDEWLARGGRSAPLLARWRELLARPVEDVIAVLTERSDDAAWLRKVSPFAGVLSPQARLKILREVRSRLERAA